MKRLLQSVAAGACLALASSASAVATGSESFLLTSAEAERIALPAGVRAVETSPMLGRLVLRTSQPEALEAALRKQPPGLCPVIELQPGGVGLGCTTRRFDARLLQHRGRPALEIRELRGLPWRGEADAPPLLPWAGCDDVRQVARGECALAAGDRRAAAAAYRAEEKETAWAAVRLGDLALLDDRPDEAARLWRAIPAAGPFGSLAQARLCELQGSCLLRPEAGLLFDAGRYPPFLQPELVLRAARMEAYLGDPRAASRFLLEQGRDLGLPALCPGGQSSCSGIVHAALAMQESRGKEDALALYFALPDRVHGPTAAPLSRTAARVARDLGAPVFAGNLAAATAGSVPDLDLEEHLHLALACYVEGRDHARAGVILDYARFRFGARRLAEPRWAQLARKVEGSQSEGDATRRVTELAAEAQRDGTLSSELAQALVAAARARSLAPAD